MLFPGVGMDHVTSVEDSGISQNAHKLLRTTSSGSNSRREYADSSFFGPMLQPNSQPQPQTTSSSRGNSNDNNNNRMSSSRSSSLRSYFNGDDGAFVHKKAISAATSTSTSNYNSTSVAMTTIKAVGAKKKDLRRPQTRQNSAKHIGSNKPTFTMTRMLKKGNPVLMPGEMHFNKMHQICCVFLSIYDICHTH